MLIDRILAHLLQGVSREGPREQVLSGPQLLSEVQRRVARAIPQKMPSLEALEALLKEDAWLLGRGDI